MRKPLYILAISFISKAVFATENTPYQVAFERSFFIENKGQLRTQNNLANNAVLFYHNNNSLQYFIRENGFSYQLVVPTSNTKSSPAINKTNFQKTESLNQTDLKIFRVDINFEGAQKPESVEKLNATDYYENHFISDPNTNQLTGITECRGYEKILLKNVYPNIDWLVYFKNGEIKYDFIVHPGGNPNHIKLNYQGVGDLQTTEAGQLIVKPNNCQEKIIENTPISFSENTAVTTSYKLVNNHTIGFELSSPYNKAVDLIIDPCLKWGSYFGGNSTDYGKSVAVDLKGNIILGGYTASTTNLATTGAFLTVVSGSYFTFYYIKINPVTSAPLYGTFVAGNLNSTNVLGGMSLINNDVVLAGYTSNGGSLLNSSSYQKTFGGGNYDGILLRFSEAGQLLWSTYIGGSGDDYIKGITTDKSGNIYVHGTTNSTTNIATAGSFKTTTNGNETSFFMKFNENGTKIYGSYLAGTTQSTVADYIITDLTCDKNGNFYMVGYSNYNYISTYNSGTYLIQAKSTSTDGFITRFSSAGTLQWFTYYGGTGVDYIGGCYTDASNNFFITGYTNSTTNIATSGTLKGLTDGFLAKFNSAGVRQFGYYYGGTNYDYLTRITIDANGDVYCSGYVYSVGLYTADAFQTSSATGVPNVITKFNNSGSIIWTTAYSSNSTSTIDFLVVDSKYDLYAGGTTSQSTEVPNTYGSRTTLLNQDAFIGKIGSGNVPNNYESMLCGGVTTVSICKKNSYTGTFAWENSSNSSCRNITTPGTFWAKTTLTAQGCVYIDTFKVGLLNNTATITQTTPYCYTGQTTNFVVKTKFKNLTTYWYNPSNVLFASTNKASANITGNYITISTAANGCKDTGKFYLSPLPLDIRIAKYQKTLPCGNSFVPEVKQGTPGDLSYSWSPNVNISNANIKDPIIIASETNKQYILTTNYNGFCTENDTLNISTATPINQSITIENTGSNIICAADDLNLKGTLNEQFETTYKNNFPITVTPAYPTREQTVKILFNAKKGNAALVGASAVYITLASITNLNNNLHFWNNIQNSGWGIAEPKNKMTQEGPDLWSYTFNIQDVFGLNNPDPTYKKMLAISHLTMLFTDSLFKKVAKTENETDIFYPVYDTMNAGIFNTPIQLIQPPILNYESLQKLNVFNNDSILLGFGSAGIMKTWKAYLNNTLIQTFADTDRIQFTVKGNINLTSDTLKITVVNTAGVTTMKKYLIQSLAATQSPTSIKWTWPDNSNSNSNSGNNLSKIITGGAAGNKNVIAQASFMGCNYNANIYPITVINSTKPNFTTTPTVICDNGVNNITLNAGTTTNNTSGSFTTNYKWIFEDNSTANTVNTTKKFTKIGTNLITLITYTDNRCIDTLKKSITVNAKPIISISSNTTNNNFCEGNTSIYGTPTFLSSYKWYYLAATNQWDLLQTNRILAPTKPGTYIIVASDVNGCKDTEEITLNKIPIHIEAPNGMSWCDSKDVITLKSTETFTKYLWNTNAINQSIQINQPGTFTVKGINGTCTTTSEPVTIIDEKRDFNANFNVVQLASMKFEFRPVIKPKYASWSFGDGNVDIQEIPQHIYGSKGYFSVCLDAKSRCGNREFKCSTLSVDGRFLGVDDSLVAHVISLRRLPNSNTYSIEKEQLGDTLIFEVISITGARIIAPQKLSPNTEFELNASSGIYVCRVWDGSKHFTIKFQHGE